MAASKIICVTGMHRSGTSLVARVVNLLGVDLGPEDELMEPKPDNPAGFWENRSIAAVNDDLLAALGGRWDAPALVADGWETQSRLDDLRARAAAILAEMGDGPLAFKDPRAALTLPFWRTVAAVEHTVLTVRPPADVAASLQRRDGIEPERAAHLWLRYTVAGWRNSPGRLVIDYDRILADANAEADRIVDHLGLAAPDDEARKTIAEFVDAGLDHGAESGDEPGPDMMAANALYRLIGSGDDGAIDVAADLFHDRWIEAERAASLERELDVVAEHRDELLGERDQALDERDRALVELERDRQTAQRLRSELDDLIAARDRLVIAFDAERTDLVEQRSRALASRDQVEAERDAEREQRRHFQERVDLQRAMLERAEADVARAGRRLRGAEDQIATLEATVADKEALLQRWRVDRLERYLGWLRR